MFTNFTAAKIMISLDFRFALTTELRDDGGISTKHSGIGSHHGAALRSPEALQADREAGRPLRQPACDGEPKGASAVH